MSDQSDRRDRDGVSGSHRPRVDEIGVHRIRRTADPHPAAAASLRRDASTGSTPRSSRTRSRRRICCPGRPRRSWRSTAPGDCAARAARSSGASVSSVRASSSSSVSRRCSSRSIRRLRSSAPPPAPGAAVPAVALNASRQLVPSSWKRIGDRVGAQDPVDRLRVGRRALRRLVR